MPSLDINDRCATTLLCAKGEPVQMYGMCAVTKGVVGELINWDAIVADIPGSEVLLGMDLLEDLDCTIHLASRILIMTKLGLSVPMYKENRQRCARERGFEMLLSGRVNSRWEFAGPSDRRSRFGSPRHRPDGGEVGGTGGRGNGSIEGGQYGLCPARWSFGTY